MKILRLTEKNIPEIYAAEKNSFSDGWNEKMLRSAFEGERFFAFGAYEGETLAGIACASVAGIDADIEIVATLPLYRRRGVAKELMEKLLSFLKTEGTGKVFLEVREKNAPALELYRKFGFGEISVRTKYYPDGENAVVMMKEI